MRFVLHPGMQRGDIALQPHTLGLLRHASFQTGKLIDADAMDLVG